MARYKLCNNYNNNKEEEVMFHPAFVRLSVCLYVCLLATSRKNYWPALREVLPEI